MDIKNIKKIFPILFIVVGLMFSFPGYLEAILSIFRLNSPLNINSSYFSFIFVSIGLGLFTLKYLQSSKEIVSNTKEPLGYITDEIEKYSSKLNELQREISSLKESQAKLSEEDKEEILKGTIKEASEESITTIFHQQTKYFKDNLKKTLGLEFLKKSFDNNINRLKREVSDLRLRANVNLVIGGVITLGGLYFLGITVEMMAKASFLTHEVDGETVPKEISEILLAYGPRVLLVIFIEIFAYFFLRLYKLGLDEIKYFQNELTNVESKLIAVEVAYITKNDDAMKEALKVLVQTERNFILKKGETTVELERAKSESENMQNILKAVPEFFKNKGK